MRLRSSGGRPRKLQYLAFDLLFDLLSNLVTGAIIATLPSASSRAQQYSVMECALHAREVAGLGEDV